MHFHLIHFFNVSEMCNITVTLQKHENSTQDLCCHVTLTETYKNGMFYTLFKTRFNAFFLRQ